MLITGARGMAKEVFEVLQQQAYGAEIFFFDDVSENVPKQLFGASVLTQIGEAEALFRRNNQFVLGLGNPLLRKKMHDRFAAINGQVETMVSPFAHIGKFGNSIGRGSTVMTGAVITNSVSLGTGVLINVNVSVSHDCTIGDFCEVSPGAVITGYCTIGDFSVVGSNATILPGLTIGKHVIVGAGAVVTKNIPDNTVVKGVPAKPVNS